MPARRRSARQQRPVPQFSCTPVTGHLPPAALYRDTAGRYCVSELQQASQLPVKVLNYDSCERPRTANGSPSQRDAVPGQNVSSPRAAGEDGNAVEASPRGNDDTTPLSRRAVTKTASCGDRGDNSVLANGAITQKSTPNHSASSGSSARRLTLALSSPESSPAPSPARRRPSSPSNPSVPSNPSSPALQRPFGSSSRPGAPRPQPGPVCPSTPASATVAGSASLTPGAFDSDGDDIFECELRSRIGDVITLLRGDTDLSASGDGGVSAGGAGAGGDSAEGSGDGDGGLGAGASVSSADVFETRKAPSSQRILNFEHVAEASGHNSKAVKNGDASVPLPANAPPCRLPPARVTADNSLAARARHVVGRRPGERVVSELAELARSPGSPLLRQAGRNLSRLARSAGRTTTPRGRDLRGARDVRGAGTGGETPVAVKRQVGDVKSPRRQAGDAMSPRRQAGDVRSPLVEKRTNVLGEDSPVLGRAEKPRGWIMSPESGVLRRRSELDASGDRKSSGDGVAASPTSEKEVERKVNARATGNSPRVAKSPLKRTLSDRENQSPRPVSRDTQRHLPAAAVGGSSAAAARGQEAEDEEIASTQPVTALVLDGVVAVVDVRSGADNR